MAGKRALDITFDLQSYINGSSLFFLRTLSDIRSLSHFVGYQHLGDMAVHFNPNGTVPALVYNQLHLVVFVHKRDAVMPYMPSMISRGSVLYSTFVGAFSGPFPVVHHSLNAFRKVSKGYRKMKKMHKWRKIKRTAQGAAVLEDGDKIVLCAYNTLIDKDALLSDRLAVAIDHKTAKRQKKAELKLSLTAIHKAWEQESIQLALQNGKPLESLSQMRQRKMLDQPNVYLSQSERSVAPDREDQRITEKMRKLYAQYNATLQSLSTLKRQYREETVKLMIPPETKENMFVSARVSLSLIYRPWFTRT